MTYFHRFLAIGLLAFASTAAAMPGELDPTFGDNGLARVPFPSTGTAVASAVQSDGRIVIVGSANEGSPASNSDILVVRLNANGTPDTTFSDDGFAIFDVGGFDAAGAVAITADNRILVAGGSRQTNLPYDVVALRVNADGTLDQAFGTAGIARSPHPSGMFATSVLPLPDGRSILAGSTGYGFGDFVFLRLDASGALDTTFGTSGRTTVDFDQARDELVRVVRLADGRIVGVGTSTDVSGWSTISAVRLLASGLPDTSVAQGKLQILAGAGATAEDVFVQPDGKLLVAGSMGGTGSASLGLIVRLLPDGGPDFAFGSGGRVLRSSPAIGAVVGSDDGRVYFAYDALVSGPPGRRIFLVALERDGSGYRDFATPPRSSIDTGYGSVASDVSTVSMHRLSDGRLLVIGQSANAELHVARVLASEGSHPGLFSVGRATGALSSAAAQEFVGNVNFMIFRSSGGSGAVSVSYAAQGTTATAGVDFTPVSGTLTWADGDMAPKTVSVPILDDLEYEASDEGIDMVLSAPTGGASLAMSSVHVSIVSDESTAQLSLMSSTAQEEAGTLKVMVSRAGDPRIQAAATYTVTSQSATAGSDFTPVSGTLTWEPFEMGYKVISIPILDDALPEVAEYVQVGLTPTNAATVIAMPLASATIASSDGLSGGEYLVFDHSPAIVDESAGSVTLTVSRQNIGITGPVTYSVTASANTAASGADFGTPDVSQLSWNAGDYSSRTITIPIVNDAIEEDTESFFVMVGGLALANVYISDNDFPGSVGSVVEFAIDTQRVEENAGAASVLVTRTGNIAFPITLEVRVSSSGAMSGIDYAFAPTTVSWQAGDGTAKTLSLQVIDDSIPESDEAVTLTLALPTSQTSSPRYGATLGARSRTIFVIAGSSSGATTGDVGFTQSAITVSEDADYVDLPVSRVHVNLPFLLLVTPIPGGTAESQREYVLASTFVQWQQNDISPVKNVRVWLNGDQQIEGDETFTIVLAPGGGIPMTIAPSSIQVTLTSDDSGQARQLAFTTTSISQPEDQTTVNVTVSRSGPVTEPLTVSYQTIAGTAEAESDFVAASGTLQWAAGDAGDKTIPITLVNDTAAESAETLAVILSSPSEGAVLGNTTATISIVDNDAAGGGGGGGAGGGGGGGGGALDAATLTAVATLVLLLLATRRRARAIVDPRGRPGKGNHRHAEQELQ